MTTEDESSGAAIVNTVQSQFRGCNSVGSKAELLASWKRDKQHRMETTETRNGHHWSLTLLGMALVVMFAYYGESVLAVLDRKSVV